MKIFAILVTYNPDFSLLDNCISSLFPQVDSIVVVNNGKTSLYTEKFLDDANKFSKLEFHIIELGKNYGIAYAQNRGIEYALSHGADYVLFSDQDTTYSDDFIQKSLACYERHKEEKIAAIVPLFYNENKKQYAQVNITKTKAITPELGCEYYVTHAISSGTVCPTAIFSDIGIMNERLFIDWVDYEWCWRAVNKGFKIICDTNIVIHHNMGDSFKNVLGRKIVVYSDFRNFYFFRNGTWLLWHSHLFNFREWIGFKKFMFLKTILFFITCGFSIKHLKLYFSAIKQGITNKFTLEAK